MKAGRIIIRAAAVLTSAAAALSAAVLKPIDAEISEENTPARFSHAVTAAAFSADTKDSSSAEGETDAGDNSTENITGEEELFTEESSSVLPRLPDESSSSEGESLSEAAHEENMSLADSGGNTETSHQTDNTDKEEISKQTESAPETIGGTPSASESGSDVPSTSARENTENSAVQPDQPTADDSSDSEEEQTVITDDGESSGEPGKDTYPEGGINKVNAADKVYFSTDITDGKHYDQPELKFTITHNCPELKIGQIEVKLDGMKQPFGDRVTLAEGKNEIYISVSYTDKDGKVITACREYTVWLDKAESEKTPPVFVTDLCDTSTGNAEFAFKAYFDGGTDDAEGLSLVVKLGGRTLEGAGGCYVCTLSRGENIITVTGGYDFDGRHTEINESYVITLEADSEAPFLEYINVPESTRSRIFTLDLIARDSGGGRLYKGNICVRLNGAEIKSSWSETTYTTYALKLAPGDNTLDIRVTDSDGLFSDYSYVIGCTAGADGEVIGSAALTVDCGVLGLGSICDSADIDIIQGQSAAEAVTKALEAMGFTVGYRGEFEGGFYLYGLYKENIAAGAEIPADLRGCLENDPTVRISDRTDPDRLCEYDFTSGSGWMVTVNGHFTTYGFSDIHLQDGNSLVLKFTLAGGRDIGDKGSGALYDVQY
ncbi:MAG: hypothetical protein K6B74_06710 [Ruminococcus sp.]|nr:hypothetical protein [Ruminococcus sp.]